MKLKITVIAVSLIVIAVCIGILFPITSTEAKPIDYSESAREAKEQAKFDANIANAKLALQNDDKAKKEVVRSLNAAKKDAKKRRSTAKTRREARRAEEKAREYRMHVQAWRHGFYRIISGPSLESVLRKVRTAQDLIDIMGSAIQLEYSRTSYKAVSVSEGRTLYTSGRSPVICLEGYTRQIIQGSRITKLNFSYAQVTGVSSYTTVMGANRQCFVVKPARFGWEWEY